jgi:HAD superfamily hydrolase (TIGR01509 family)
VRYRTVLFDVDGTLVDSNDAHAHAWIEAFGEQGVTIAFAPVRRCIGMGGDKLMPEVSGIEEDSPLGKVIARRRGEIFKERFLRALHPFRDAQRLLSALKERGYTMVAASSAKQDELEPLLQIAGAAGVMDGATSADDAASSKPAPDIVHAALTRANASSADALMIGDTPYDIEAARRADVAVIAFRCGGWNDSDLSGARAIYDGPWDLLARLDDSPLGGR